MIYIKDTDCISPQHTYGKKPFASGLVIHEGTRYFALEPDYSGLIPRGQLRRMGKFSRMGVGAGARLATEHRVDGIITATANGGLENSVGFLNQIMQYDEGTLTPSHFVQSTSNSVSGLLSLMSKNTGYNATHVHLGLAFETALLDAMMLFEEKVAANLLVGCVEAISVYNYNIDVHRGLLKPGGASARTLLNSGTPGFVAGEGAAMFVFTALHGEDQTEILDVHTLQSTGSGPVLEAVLAFLEKNRLKPDEVGTLILGMNGDITGDHFYRRLATEIFPEQPVVTYKNFVGEYPTSSGFALWLAGQKDPLPGPLYFRTGPRKTDITLLYNHYLGEQHGFILTKNSRT